MEHFLGRGTDNDTWINKLNHLVGLGEFVGVYPQGYQKMWNSGGNESSKADDVAFVGDIIDELKEYKNLYYSYLKVKKYFHLKHQKFYFLLQLL